MKARLFPLIGALAAALALASCGVKTGLERPAPMFGKQREHYLAEQERLKAAAAGAPSATPEALPPPDIPIGRTPISPTNPYPPPSSQPPG